MLQNHRISLTLNLVKHVPAYQPFVVARLGTTRVLACRLPASPSATSVVAIPSTLAVAQAYPLVAVAHGSISVEQHSIGLLVNKQLALSLVSRILSLPCSNNNNNMRAPRTDTPEARVFQAIDQGDYQYVASVVSQGQIDVNHSGRYDSYPNRSYVERAVAGGQHAIVQLLLDHRANATCASLCLAAANGNTSIAELLVERTANVNQASDGDLPLSLAAFWGHLELVELLLLLRANVDATDEHNCTALHEAARAGRHAIAMLLIDAGASVSTIGSFTPEGHHRNFVCRSWRYTINETPCHWLIDSMVAWVGGCAIEAFVLVAAVPNKWYTD
jgi:ankyrin repeat protein